MVNFFCGCADLRKGALIIGIIKLVNNEHLFFDKNHLSINDTRWQKFREGAKCLRRKVWTYTKIHFFGNKVLFFSNTVLIGHYNMVYITYYTESNLQICKCAQKRCVCRENSKYAPDESFVASFALAERLPPMIFFLIEKIYFNYHDQSLSKGIQLH